MMAKIGETIHVVYESQSNMWYVEDQYGDIVGEHTTKKEAVLPAKRLAKDRATATGVKTRLEIEKTDGSLSKVHEYEPAR